MSDNNYHHGDLKAELIREGLLLLDKEGYDGLSLRKVAKACGVSQTAPYRHFKDKNELVEAIKAEALSNFNKHLEQAVDAYPDDPEKQLSEMGIAYIKFFVENPEYLRLLFLSNYQNKSCADFTNQPEHLTSGHPFKTYLNAVERYYKSDTNQPLEPDEIMLYSWGLVHGIAILVANNEVKLQKDYLTIVRKLFEMGNNTIQS
jgi:AcrR family transcriptional regulator